MQIIEVDVNNIIPYDKNAKKHPAEQVEHIANSIKEFGFKQPLVIDKDNVLVIGHGRLAAAKQLGIDKVPCLMADDLTEDQIKALRLADNKTNESGWDFDFLNIELDDITDIDMSQFGFDIGADGDSVDVVSETDTNFNYTEQYGVIVMCENETDQEKIYNELTAEGYVCKVVAV